MAAVSRLVREKQFGWYDEQYPGQLLSRWEAFVDRGDTGEVFGEDVLLFRDGLNAFLSFDELENFEEFQWLRLLVISASDSPVVLATPVGSRLPVR